MHGARHGPSMRQYRYHKAHDMLRKARKHKNGYKNILYRWNKDDKYHKSLPDIGRTEEQIIQCDEIALEDHSNVATQQERNRNETSWKLSLNAEDVPEHHCLCFLVKCLLVKSVGLPGS